MAVTNYKQFGASGEDRAAAYLKKNGYVILARNYTMHSGEIDIIARDGTVLCFVEVKARRSLKSGHPLEAITDAKKRKITCLASLYIAQKYKQERLCRFDVVSVLWREDRDVEIQLIKNAFDATPGVF